MYLPEGATFQSPTNRVNTSNPPRPDPRPLDEIVRFNPLQIGSTLQIRHDGSTGCAWREQFQSPTNRVNTSNKNGLADRIVEQEIEVSIPYKSGQHFKLGAASAWVRKWTMSFNPLQIGSTLQIMDDDTALSILLSGTSFNPLQIGSTLQIRGHGPPKCGSSSSGFNPLQIGSTLQIHLCGPRFFGPP